MSIPRTIRGGSPQGTLLGNLLFMLTTNNIEDEEPDKAMGQTELNQSHEEISISASTPMGIERTLSNLSNVSLIEGEYLQECERTLRYEMSDTELEESAASLEASYWIAEHPPPNHWRPRPLMSVKFIDDLTAASKAFLPASYQIFSQNKPQRVVHAKACQSFYETVQDNAFHLGLTVNSKKTQLLCVNSAIGSDVSSYINISNTERIRSQSSLKILRFHLSAHPGIGEQVAQLKKKYRKREWIIRNLKRAGLNTEDLVMLYKTLVRPVLDYMSAVYHPMLSIEQSRDIERLQMGTLKSVFGYDKSYATALQLSGLPSLAERRQQCFDKFAIKLATNPDYEHWLPKTTFTGHDLREELIYIEKFASTDRLRSSPLYAIRRRLNEIYLHSNKSELNRRFQKS